MRYVLKNNQTELEKRSPAMEITDEFDCTTATYKTVTLVDFVYKHNCFPSGWDEFLREEEVKEDIQLISEALAKDAKKYSIEPPMPNMFKAFTVSPDRVKAVILGQDPTPQANKATGLAFSLKPGEDPRTVPSVFNMLIELKLEGMTVSLTNGDLTPWLNEGVLLLNAALTVIQGSAGSHQNFWKEFTEMVVKYVSKVSQPSAWILWGTHAQGAKNLIAQSKHYIKLGGHPSPIGGRPNEFIGGNYFHCANQFLIAKERGGINWQINHQGGLLTDMAPC